MLLLGECRMHERLLDVYSNKYIYIEYIKSITGVHIDFFYPAQNTYKFLKLTSGYITALGFFALLYIQTLQTISCPRNTSKATVWSEHSSLYWCDQATQVQSITACHFLLTSIWEQSSHNRHAWVLQLGRCVWHLLDCVFGHTVYWYIINPKA